MKGLLVVYILIFIGFEVFGQGKLTDEKRKEFDAQKVAFLHKNWICLRRKLRYSGLCIMKCRKRKKGLRDKSVKETMR